MSWQASTHVRDLDPRRYAHVLNGSDRAVLFVLATFHDPEKGCAWPSIATIADKAYVSESTARRCVRRCEKAGILHIEERKTPKGQRTHRFRFCGLDPLPVEGAPPVVVTPPTDGNLTPRLGVELTPSPLPEGQGLGVTAATEVGCRPGDTRDVIENADHRLDATTLPLQEDVPPLDPAAACLVDMPSTVAGVVGRVRQVLDADHRDVSALDDRAARYAWAYDVAAPAAAEKYASVPGVSVALIRAAIVEHAAAALLPNLEPRQLERLNSAVTQHGSAAIHLMPVAARNATKDRVSYLKTCCAERVGDAAGTTDVLRLVSRVANTLAAQ